MERYDPGMVRHTRIVAATAVALAGLFSGALAPAAGDQRVTGSSQPHVRYTADGIPYVDFGPECKAGHGHKKSRHPDRPDASDY